MATQEDFNALKSQIEQLKLELHTRNVRSVVSTSTGGLPESKHLKGNINYSDWKFYMKNFLVDACLWKCIEHGDDEVIDPDTDMRTLAKINMSIKSNVCPELKKAKTAKEAWTMLENTFEDKGTMRLVSLYSSLFKVKFESFHSIQDYMEHIFRIAEQLENMGEPLKDTAVGGIILGGLPEQFKPLILGIQGSNQKTTTEFVKTLLLQDGVKNLTQEPTAGNNDSVFFTKSAKLQKPRGPRCYACNNYGHKSNACTKKHSTTKRREQTNVIALCKDLSKSGCNDWFID